MCPSYSSLCCHWTSLGLRQPMLHAPGNVQHVLPLDVPVLQHLSCLWTCLAGSCICCLWTFSFVSTLHQPVLPMDSSVLQQRGRPLEAWLFCAFPGHVYESVVQQSVLSPEVLAWSCMLVLQMHVFVQQQTLLRQEVYGLQHCSLGCIFTVCLQEPVHFLGVSIYMGFCAVPGLSVYKSFVLHLDVSVNKNLCCTCACLSTRTSAVPVRVCLQELCDAPGHVFLQEYRQRWNCRCSVVKIFLVCFGLFRNRYVYFGCFDTCSKHRNKPKK